METPRADLLESVAVLEELLAASGAGSSVDEENPLPMPTSVGERIHEMRYVLNAGATSDETTKLPGFSALHQAAGRGDIAALAQLLEGGADVHSTAQNLGQPIHCAALGGQPVAAEFLLDHAAQIEAVDKDEWTPLHFASYRGDVSTMALLVARGADVHRVTKDGRTTLYLSVAEGKFEAVEYLLNQGVAVDATADYDWSVLHAAAERGDVRIMALLVERGADIHAKAENGELPVHVAAGKGNIEATKYLLDLGASADATYSDGLSVLHWAARSGDVMIMALLVQHGADIHILDKSGRSLLHESALSGRADVVEFLIEQGVALDVVDDESWSVLHFAANSGDVNTIRLLAGRGVDLHALTQSGQSTLNIAAWEGHADAVQCLLEYGVAQSADLDGWTPLHGGAAAGDVRTMEILIKHGADVHCVDETGGNVLHHAVYHGQVNALSYILDLNVEINTIDENDGDWGTPLMFAVRYHSIQIASEMAFILCSRGAEWKEEHRQQAMRCDESDASTAVERRIRQRWREGLCVCIKYWSHHHLTTLVPIEVIARGPASVESYITDIAASGAKRVANRCKLCVVGPSGWGKTSLVRTLVARKPSLTHLQDRTIGVDLVTCVFQDDTGCKNDSSSAQVEATFWDFAGQTVYHVAHGPFFSRRTLYIVVVDVDAYSKILQDAQSKPRRVMEAMMNRFISRHILRWLTMILAYQPDARFVFVGTKTDCIEDEPTLKLIQDVRNDVQDRVEVWERSHTDRSGDAPGNVPVRRSASFEWFSLNIHIAESVRLARQFVNKIISSSDIGFPMGKMYSTVLRKLKARREDARSAPTQSERLESSIVLFKRLRRDLMGEIDGLKYQECEIILQTLRDLGDILWYDHEDAGVLKDFIILDPLLVIDVVREVI